MNRPHLIFFLFWSCISCAQTASPSKTKIADSLDLAGEHEKALAIRTAALQENTLNPSNFLQAKWYYTKSCILENKGGQDNHREALRLSLKARKLCREVNPNKNIHFQYLINNRIYHQYGYLGKWNKALIEAKLDMDILLDSVPEHSLNVLYIMDDLGYIYTRIGDPERANQYYKKSHAFYKEYHPKEMQELYVNFDRMAENYKNLGLRHEEYNLLSELENYWEKNTENTDAYFHKFNTFKRLAEWYNFYGNYKLSENYLKKEEMLFDAVSKSHKVTEQKALDRRDLWDLYLNYIHLYQNLNRYDKVDEYLDKTRKILKESKRYYSWDVIGEINLYALEASLPNKTLDESINKLESAINLAKKNEHIHFTDPTPYQQKLLGIYKANGKISEAQRLLNTILENPELSDNKKFQLYCLKGSLLAEQSKTSQAQSAFETGLGHILKSNTKSELSKISIGQIKEFYNYDTLEGLLLLGNFKLDSYKNLRTEQLLTEAIRVFLLCSRLFDNIYIGDKYNSKLYHFYKAIESGLVSCLVYKNDDSLIDTCFEALEKNASKLTWTKFVYSSNKQQIKVPDSVLNEELKLKTLLNYYQNALYATKKEKGFSTDSLHMRIVDLNKKLRNNQEYVHDKYLKYYNRSTANFNMNDFKNSLNDNHNVLQFSFINNSLYVLVLSNKTTKLIKLSDNFDLRKTISDFAKNLSKFNSKTGIPDALIPISKLLVGLNCEQLTIIPSETLNLVPFETLIPDYFKSNLTINYSSSLSLLNEQKKTTIKKRQINVGIFTGQKKIATSDVNFLPSVRREIEYISKECPSITFYGATKEIFIKQATTYNVLHLATHSTIDNETPELSNLNFHQGDLLVGELYNETLKSDLAVLSACDTGSGSLLEGEGVQSVSKAFTYAGVPSTVVSLWKVDDKATATIMASFYKYLNIGKSKDLALKLAKRDYVHSDLDIELKHPYYWSGFVLLGNTDPFSAPKNSNLWWLALLALPFGLFYYYKRS